MNWDTEDKQIESGAGSTEKDQAMMEYHKTQTWALAILSTNWI